MVICQILIKKTRDGAHRPGQKVEGTVKYIIDEPTEYKDIVLCLIGKGRCSWTETRRVNNQRERVHYIGTETYVSVQLSMLRKKSPDAVMIGAGSYEQDFKFELPVNIPSTYNDANCTIAYYLKLRFIKEGIFSRNKTFNAEIIVISYVNAENVDSIVFGIEKKLMKLFSKKKPTVSVRGELDKPSFKPGDIANLSFIVNNDTDIVIPAIKTEVTAHMIYTANSGRQTSTSKTIKECTVETPSVPDNGIANMSNVIAILREFYTVQNSKIFERRYEMNITLKLPFPHMNASVVVPIVIGEKQCYDNLEINTGFREDVDLEVAQREAPPSYWQVMAEDKENYAFD